MANTVAKISNQKAEDILLSCYGISGSATFLPGEIDLNFKIIVGEKSSYILKISPPHTAIGELDFQQQLLLYLQKQPIEIEAPHVIYDLQNNAISSCIDHRGEERLLRLISWFEGRLWSDVNPHTTSLRYGLGRMAGKVTKALKGFDHPFAHRDLEWDTAQSLWILEKLSLFEGEQKKMASYFTDLFEKKQETYKNLPKTVVHNDANNNNVLVSEDISNPKVAALIDYGDAIFTQRINDVGITCAYASMGHKEALRAVLPIVQGYHASCPLEETELAHLYVTIGMRLVTTVTKAAMNRISEPENIYHFVSEKPAWEALAQWFAISEEFANMRFRESCQLPPHPARAGFDNWVSKNPSSLDLLFPSIGRTAVSTLDLSVSSSWIGHQVDFNNIDLFQFKIEQLQKGVPKKIIAGGYLEPRALYTDDSFDTEGDYGKQSRSVHLGVDFWLPAQTAVHAIYSGEVVTSTFQTENKNYGGLIILKHQFEEITFYTLYGHLSKESVQKCHSGDIITKGQCFASLGISEENGNWAPHLHFQVQLSLLNYKNDFPGVAFHHEIETWKSLCPDPMSLFGIDTLGDGPTTTPNDTIISFRKKHLGSGMSLQYQSPIQVVRGNGVYLMDQFGKKYLDTVNNVAHIGHEHSAAVCAARDQIAVLNTNSRYLHNNVKAFAEALLETLPDELSVLHFVNSGSEANELAIRMAKAVTGSNQIIASEIGYHGNTNMCVDISSYKFDGKGGNGAPHFTHIFPLPDTFRGRYRGPKAGESYVFEVSRCIEAIHAKGEKVSAFIIESIISCGGQIELPDGFLKKAFASVRNAGGVCISDEVQTGVGRMGKSFWGFQLHDVIPDIVTIGKPIGNGHPLAVVACTPEVGRAFANGMEFFNTFGGNPVSCAIGTAVLQTVKNENLQQHAQEVGSFLKKELKTLSAEFPIIGQVRGQGLFLGFELVDSDLNPLATQTDYLINRMKEHSILMSSDGPDHNVIKIKPPMVFSLENAKTLVFYLRKIFQEDLMKP